MPTRRAKRPFSITARTRSEEYTSELQSQSNVVCRPLLEKKNVSQFGATPRRSLHGRARDGKGPVLRLHLTPAALSSILSLHDALPISRLGARGDRRRPPTAEPPPSRRQASPRCRRGAPSGPSQSQLELDRKSTRLNSSHSQTSYADLCLKKKTCLSLGRPHDARCTVGRETVKVQFSGYT